MEVFLMFRKRTIYLVLIFFCAILVNNCRTRKKGSHVTTTSDRLKEFSYEIEAELKLPVDRDVYIYAHLADLLRKKADHPDDMEEGANIDKIVSNIGSLTESFNETYREGFPIINSQGQIDRSKIRYWIARHIKFSSNALKNMNLSLTLDKTNENINITAVNNGDYITVKYRASFLGTTQNDYLSDPGAKLKTGDTISLPQNPLKIYFDTISPSIVDVYRRGISAVKDQGDSLDDAANDLETHLSTTRNLGEMLVSPCNITDGDAISPFNYFYYFDSSKEGCQAEVVVARVVAVNELSVKTTYPEYHRLFADNKLDFFIYYNKVGEEAPRASRNVARYLKEKQYSLVSFDLAWSGSGDPRPATPEDLFSYEFVIKSYKFAKNINGITYNVDVVVRDQFDDAQQKFRDAIGSKEIIVYDGHAGYGANIDSNFSVPESYPENTYQIFFLNGCSTYKYGMAEILTAKAFRDFDFNYLNADVVTSSNSIQGHSQQIALLDMIELAGTYYQVPLDKWTEEAKSTLSWLGVITKINIASDRDGNDKSFFMVSGEQGNTYQPGVNTYISPSITPIALEKVILSEEFDINLRFKALKIYIPNIIKANSKIEDSLSQIKKLCLKLGPDLSSKEDFQQLFYKNCNLQSIPRGGSGTVVLNGIEFAIQSGIYFYENMQVRSGHLSRPQKLKGGELGEILMVPGDEFTETGFSDTGTVSYGTIGQDTSVNLQQGTISISSGQNIQLDSEGRVSGFFTLKYFEYEAYKGILCIFEPNSWVFLPHSRITVSECWLKEDAVFKNVALKGKTQISFTETGEPWQFMISKDTILSTPSGIFSKNKVIFAANTYIRFNEKSEVTFGALGEPVSFSTMDISIDFPAKTTLDIVDDIISFDLPESQEYSKSFKTPVGQYPCEIGVFVYPGQPVYNHFHFFLKTRHPTSCLLEENVHLSNLNIAAKKGWVLVFNEEGTAVHAYDPNGNGQGPGPGPWPDGPVRPIH